VKEGGEGGGDVEAASTEELNSKITTLEKEKNKEEEYRNYMQLERVRLVLRPPEFSVNVSYSRSNSQKRCLLLYTRRVWRENGEGKGFFPFFTEHMDRLHPICFLWGNVHVYENFKMIMLDNIFRGEIIGGVWEGAVLASEISLPVSSRTKSMPSGKSQRKIWRTRKLSSAIRTGRWRKWRSGTRSRSRCDLKLANRSTFAQNQLVLLLHTGISFGLRII
jgi:hypothetical protein